MKKLERFYPEARFGGFTDIDGTVVFFTRVNSLLKESMIVLDAGCGRGAFSERSVPTKRNLRTLKGKVAKVIGIDVDSAAAVNPTLDEFRLIEGDRWPVEDDSIDLIVCDNVLEHVADYESFFSELRRVLRDGGYLCLRTPNRWNYITLGARLIPNKHHSAVTSVVQAGREEEDVFPTVYKCNTAGKLRRVLRDRGFDCVVYGYEAEPKYLDFSTIAYFLGVLHQRFAPRFLKPSLFAFGELHKASYPFAP